MSSSSAPIDQRRKDALKAYRGVRLIGTSDPTRAHDFPSRKCNNMRLAARVSRTVSPTSFQPARTRAIDYLRGSSILTEGPRERLRQDGG